MIRHWSKGPEPPEWYDTMLDTVPPVGVILILCIGCWAMFILAGWGLWSLIE
jgi:hypothetical protein